ncbi:8-amino-7-oxononanoate synthase [Alteromonas sp.]|jgi:8-amino-7-oxononanoate synthase|uniref:aminotransferase class I/II-fold pyridoxal phosphate-dependent enzyme n=1 Tax=Alteromonas sp. TaxID=232 RepID=UPI000B7183FF|nr:8-amino-7-oxononanoate synthase [Alteromonas sp.]MAI38301.1 8-amino-7-oxononanoate synthase [Alteromonas sp.]OUX86059.1 MAG: 8-amino-7-oxononanoate synthase [Alteromonas sp. TMED35]|tara:strand:- start:18861 stop:20108 length:1248 start_codon:yes stop_codon:yes gene_type:complete
MSFSWLEDALTQRAQVGLLRQRVCQQYEKDNVICINGDHYLNFSSNDYLGMRQHEGVLQSWVEGLAQFGGGSGASPLVTGHTQAHLALEATLADGLNREAALLFSSGFAANQAVCTALFGQGSPSASAAQSSAIFADKLMHASFLEGAMSLKKNVSLRRFRHNNVEHLASLLSARGSLHTDALIASEGVFSMDGDQAPVKEIAALAEQHRAWFMLDDAHGMGVYGDNGFGTVEELQLSQSQAPIVMGTFGKAIGTGGAFIAGSQTLIDYLVNFSKHYVYSTAMPPAQAVATLYSLTHIGSDTSRREKLAVNIEYFRARFAQEFGEGCFAHNAATAGALSLVGSRSAIQPVIVGCPERAVALSDALKERGMWVSAIRQPTVPKNEDRLRITLTATHTEQDIDMLVDALALANGAIS